MKQKVVISLMAVLMLTAKVGSADFLASATHAMADARFSKKPDLVMVGKVEEPEPAAEIAVEEIVIEEIELEEIEIKEIEIAEIEEIVIDEPVIEPEEPIKYSSMAEYIPTEYDGPMLSDEDRDLLVRCVHAEAGNQCLEGRVAVACVVLNRVDSDKFPGSISEVLSQRNQFATWPHMIRNAKPTEEDYEAVDLAVQERAYKDILFFTAGYYNPSCKPAYVIEDHYFGY